MTTTTALPDVRRIRILLPTAPPAEAETSATFSLDRPIRGVRIGLRLDASWRSYYTVVDAWERRLRDDGADPIVHLSGERVGPSADRTRSDLDEWSRLIECGVVGLGN